jgi:Lysine methyltransferase
LTPTALIAPTADVMYIDDAVAPLVQTLAAVSDVNTLIYIAHGRNRQAEASFLAAAEAHFAVREVPSDDLDGVYQCTDVTVWCLTQISQF